MLKNKIFLFIFFLLFIVASCHKKQNAPPQFKKQTNTNEIVMVTPIGNLQFKLYEETPKHSDNFYKLVKKGFYDNSLLHLIIADYSIQGGEFLSHGKKILNDEPDNPDSWIESEINPQMIHKNGALSGLRQSNELNPEKKSNPHQFFIVVGKNQTELSLKMVESKINQQMFYEKFSIKYPYQPPDYASDSQLTRYKSEYNNNYLKEYATYKNQFIYSEQQREIYKNKGGLPQLDMNYSIFGELIDGWEVLDKLGGVMTDKNYVPVEEIKIKIFVVE